MLHAHLCFDEIFAFISNHLCKKHSSLGLFGSFGQGIDLQTISKLLSLWNLAEPGIFCPGPKASMPLSVRKQHMPHGL